MRKILGAGAKIWVQRAERALSLDGDTDGRDRRRGEREFAGGPALPDFPRRAVTVPRRSTYADTPYRKTAFHRRMHTRRTPLLLPDLSTQDELKAHVATSSQPFSCQDLRSGRTYHLLIRKYMNRTLTLGPAKLIEVLSHCPRVTSLSPCSRSAGPLDQFRSYLSRFIPAISTRHVTTLTTVPMPTRLLGRFLLHTPCRSRVEQGLPYLVGTGDGCCVLCALIGAPLPAAVRKQARRRPRVSACTNEDEAPASQPPSVLGVDPVGLQQAHQGVHIVGRLCVTSRWAHRRRHRPNCSKAFSDGTLSVFVDMSTYRIGKARAARSVVVCGRCLQADVPCRAGAGAEHVSSQRGALWRGPGAAVRMRRAIAVSSGCWYGRCARAIQAAGSGYHVDFLV
ncbi:hypothetical protein FA95DRAFT_1630858 [Auriscalpium vulgare]|uniref:Uncharacterized protein n=1 Tax=Auriscalpium vulgare TaxID=40419 RepID=A0ACB8RGL9_9AGAM|nr:hypothetical protein FA95DRAFT_1630858 [Auriscalpium vulgare]